MEQREKFLLITGASSGIGASVALKLSKDYNLILSGRNEDNLQKIKSQCSKERKQVVYNFDLEKIEEIESSFSKFIASNGFQITHFVHCAGFMKMIPIKTVSVGEIKTSFAINAISAALLIKTLVQRKINFDALRAVVFVSSNISNFGAKAFSAYAPSKAALDSLMRCLAIELAPKVRINSVLPGAIHTEMTKVIFENKELVEKMEKDYPLGLGDATDIYEAVNFLLSERSKWITGQQIVIDGGRTINISA